MCVSACVDFYLFADAAGLRWSPRRRLLNGYQWKAINAALIYCNLISFPFGHLRVFYIANYVQTRLGRGQRLAAPKVGVGSSPPTGLFIVCRTWFTRLTRQHKKLAFNFVYPKSTNTLYIYTSTRTTTTCTLGFLLSDNKMSTLVFAGVFNWFAVLEFMSFLCVHFKCHLQLLSAWLICKFFTAFQFVFPLIVQPVLDFLRATQTFSCELHFDGKFKLDVAWKETRAREMKKAQEELTFSTSFYMFNM